MDEELELVDVGFAFDEKFSQELVLEKSLEDVAVAAADTGKADDTLELEDEGVSDD